VVNNKFPISCPFGNGSIVPLGEIIVKNDFQVVLENSNMAKLASKRYLVVHSLPKEDRYATDDASARELYTILVSESTV